MKHILQKPLHRIFFYILLCLLPTQLGLHFWPSWSLVLGRRIDYLSPTLFGTDLLLIGLFFSWVATCNFHSVFQSLRKNRFSILSLILLLSFTTVFAQNGLIALFGWILWIKIGVLTFYIYKTRPSLQELVIPLTFAAVWSTFLGLAQFFTHGSLNGVFWILGERFYTTDTPNIARSVICLPVSSSCIEYLRPYATFSHPNVLGGFLGIQLLLLTMYGKNKHSRFTNLSRIEWIFGLVSVIGLLATFSRSAWLATTLCATFLFPFKNTKAKTLFIFGTLILFFILLSPFSDQNESVQVRSQLNVAAIQMVIRQPWFGVGNHNFLIALPHSLPMRTIYFLQPVHNLYLLLLSEWGVVGLLLFFFTLSPILMVLKKNVIHKDKQIFFLPLLFIGIIGLFDHYFLTLQQGQLLLAVSVGVTLSSLNTSLQT